MAEDNNIEEQKVETAEEQTVENTAQAADNAASETAETTAAEAEEAATAEPVDERDAKIAELEAQVAAQKDQYLRLYAEFDNYKKRTLKEKAELIQTAGKNVLEQMLPLIDDVERAMVSV
ncbi:MAG: nucleotide exchange factor GrpE, partial [Paludibacteraceae bacterium]|nr:nucleotide exchange factor GrpE [Paludibacteraceae bacterium]